jgi:hypothetical protein
LNDYLEEVLAHFAFDDGTIPALYGDAIFANRAAMVARPKKKARMKSNSLLALHRRLSTVRIKEEHVFAFSM